MKYFQHATRAAFPALLVTAFGHGCSTVRPTSPDAWAVDVAPETGTASALVALESGERVLDDNDPAGSAIRFVTGRPELFGVADAPSLASVRVSRSTDGRTFVHLQQLAGKLPLVDARAVVTFAEDGSVALVTGPLHRLRTTTLPTIGVSRMQAESQARRTLLAACRLPGAAPTVAVDYRLVAVDDRGRAVPAHEFVLAADSCTRSVVVDATTGGVLRDRPAASSETGRGTNSRGTSVTFPVATDGDEFELRDARRATGTKEVYASDRRGNVHRAGALDGPWRPEALDAYTTILELEPWFEGQVGVGAARNLGLADVPLRIALGGKECGNASASWFSGIVTFGYPCTAADTDVGSRYSPATRAMTKNGPSVAHQYSTDADTVAHEYAHLVSGMANDAEAGTVSESLSDTFAIFFRQRSARTLPRKAFEFSTEGHTPGIPIRDLGDPQGVAFSQGPRRWSERWLDPDDDDDGGVHANSLVPSYAFYLMAAGGTHPDSKVSIPGTLSYDALLSLYSTLLQHQLKANSSVREVALQLLDSAGARGVKARETVYCAWRAVEVFAANDDATLGRGASCAPMVDAGADVAAPPAPAPDASAPPTRPADCTGKTDGVYCDPYVSPRDAIVCDDRRRTGGTQCPTGKACDPSKDGQPSTQPDAFCK